MATTTLTTITNSMRYGMNDADAPYSIDKGDSLGLIKTWANAGLQWINREVPHIESNAVILPDGSTYIYDLNSGMVVGIGADDFETAITDFMKLKLVSVLGSNGKVIKRHGRGVSYIRDIVASSAGMQVGTPNYYSMKGLKTIWFNRVKAAPADETEPLISEVFTVDYWAKQKVLSAGGDSPIYPLDDGWHKLIVWASIYQAADEIGGSLGDELGSKAHKILFGRVVNGEHIQGEIDRFRGWTAENDLEGESSGMIYSNLGDLDVHVDEDYVE